MATKKELASKLVELEGGDALPVDELVDAYTHEELQDMLSEARENVKSDADDGFIVADGVCITSKRGMLKAGDVVRAIDFVGGDDSIGALLKSGKITAQ